MNPLPSNHSAKGISKTGLVPDMNGTMKIPLKGLKSKLSLQASTPYNAVEEQKRNDAILHNILSTDRNKKFFVSGGRTNIINPTIVPMTIGDTYVEPWGNPMLVRGVPKDQGELLESAYTRKALFATPPDKYCAVLCCAVLYCTFLCCDWSPSYMFCALLCYHAYIELYCLVHCGVWCSLGHLKRPI